MEVYFNRAILKFKSHLFLSRHFFSLYKTNPGFKGMSFLLVIQMAKKKKYKNASKKINFKMDCEKKGRASF